MIAQGAVPTVSKGVELTTRQYADSVDKWLKSRDCFDGSDAVKAQGRKYLPGLASHDDPTYIDGEKKYQEYKLRALYYNATRRTVQALAGAIFQKTPTYQHPPEIEEHLKDVTLGKVPASVFGLELTTLVLKTGRGGVLVDMPPVEEVETEKPKEKPEKEKPEEKSEKDEKDDEDEKETAEGEDKPQDDEETKGEEDEKDEETKKKVYEQEEASPDEDVRLEAGGDRPYWCLYEPEQITNWRVEKINGTFKLVLVVLKECRTEVDPADKFKMNEIVRYRVLELLDGKYQQEIWERMDEKDKEFRVVETIPGTRRGEQLDFIPFMFFGPTSVSPEVQPSPIEDLVEVNLSHYRTMADLEHGRHWTALPTPYVTGAAVAKDKPLAIGSGEAWVLEKGATAGMLEFGGQGLQALVSAEADKRKMMATLGARLLEDSGITPGTATEFLGRHGGEHASLRTIAETVEQGLSIVMQWHAWWVGTEMSPEEIETKYELNKDFFSVRATPEELSAQLALLQAEAISYETFYHNITKGGVTRPGVTAEDEKQKIEEEAPADDPLLATEEDPENPGFDLDGNPIPVEDPENPGFDTEGNPMAQPENEDEELEQVEDPDNPGYDMDGKPMRDKSRKRKPVPFQKRGKGGQPPPPPPPKGKRPPMGKKRPPFGK